MLVRTENGCYEIVRLHGHDYILTEDGRAIPVIAGGAVELATILIAAVVVSIVAAGASAYMQYRSGQQQKKAAKSNAAMLEREAALKRQAAAARAGDIRKTNQRMLAAEAAKMGVMGVEATPGTSPLAVMAYSARESELDALRAEWSGDASAEASFANARMARFQGDVAAYTGTVGAGTTLLSGLSSAGRSYARA